MIKFISTMAVILLTFAGLSAQTIITLDSCINLSKQNHPLSKQKSEFEKINVLKTNNLKSNYLPSLTFNAKATYQSQTFSIDIQTPPGMTINFPIPPLDQYSVYAEAKQVIWDGGITKSLKETESLNLLAEIKKNEIEIIKLEEQVENVYFSILFYIESEKQLNVIINDLKSRRKSVVSATENGILTSDNIDIIDAELLKLEQKIAGIKESRKASISILKELTSVEFEEPMIFAEPQVKIIPEFTGTNKRDELELFDIQKQILNSNINSLNKKRMPQLYIFAQGGYGNPGLTMIKDEWSTYYLAGAMLSWNIWDKNITKRTNEILKINSELIDNQEEIFNKNIIIASNNELAEILKLESYIVTDLKIIALRENISKKAEIKLDNGTITSSEYISTLNEKNTALIDYQIHKIQLLKANRNYLRIINL
jgi:outer membrane protein TolC